MFFLYIVELSVIVVHRDGTTGLGACYVVTSQSCELYIRLSFSGDGALVLLYKSPAKDTGFNLFYVFVLKTA